MIPTICHSGRGKTMEAVKRSVVQGLGWGGDGTNELAEHRGFLRL